MDLSTNYMGLKLKNPIIVSSSKLTGDIDSLESCEKAGAGAVVLKSVFEEQIRAEAESTVKHADYMYYWFPEAKEQVLDLSIDTKLDRYLRLIKEAKQKLNIPVIASINCRSSKDWTIFSKSVQDAGADAIELNISVFPFNDSQSSSEIENIYLEIVEKVIGIVNIPVSVKLSPYFTNICNIVSRMVEKGVASVTIFNRLFKPDIDIDTLKPVTDINLSSPEELLESMRWIALMKGNEIGCQLAASTGVHDHIGAIKQILSGADVVQICSTLYLNGFSQIEFILKGIESYMIDKSYSSLDEFRGKAVGDEFSKANFERIQFMKRDFS